MALFKIFRGTKEEFAQLEGKYTEGYAYVTVDGNFYVDISPTQRIQINAGKLDDGVKTVEIDDIVLKTEVIPVAQGGTGLATLAINGVLVGNGTDVVKLIPTKSGAFYSEGDNTEPKFGALPIAQGGTSGTTADQARTNLSVYSKAQIDNKVDEVATQAYPATLTVEKWTASENMFYQDWNNAALSCGKNHDVPPTVFCIDENKDDYFKIDSYKTEATSQTGIRFWATEKPANPIGLIIIDNK